jgi:hypothetical protein
MSKPLQWTYNQTIVLPVVLIVIATILCTYLTLFHLPYVPADGALPIFYASFAKLLGIPGFVGVTLLIGVLSWVLTDSYLHPTKRNSRLFLRTYSSFSISTLSALFIAFHFSFFASLLLTYNTINPLQQNIPADLSSEIDTKVETSSAFLTQNKNCYAISFSEHDAFTQVSQEWLSINKYSPFILQAVVPDMAKLNYLTLPKRYGVFVFKERLYVIQAPPDFLSPIAAPLAQKLIQCELADFPTKTFPEIKVFNEESYDEYVNIQLSSLLKLQDQYIKDADKNISELTSLVNRLKRARYSARVIADAEKNLNEWIAYKQELLTDKEELSRRIKQPKQEVGHFFPPKSVSVKYIAERDGFLTVSTLVHEYLHYVSDTQDRHLDRFFEEGLTQYFTLKVMAKYQSYSTTTTYPLPVFTILSLDKVSPQFWKKLYFSKDTSLLEKELDSHYGAGFYKDTQLVFNAVYDSSQDSDRKKLSNTLQQYGIKDIPEEALTTPRFWDK